MVRHYRLLASYGCDARASRGRLFAEAASPTRSDFQRDRDRIIHSTAFRRLAHKTQVFVPLEGDHFRTRLTHTIEVAQIARALARALGLDEDLAEALALAHDLGHTPFGHTGEDVLREAMRDFGGFDHNAQALRIVTKLERHYAQFDGLNLTWEMLEGLVKHNGPLLDAQGRPLPRYMELGIPGAILQWDRRWPLDLASFASMEAQVAAIADDIAYNAHDIDDGLRAGLFGIDGLRGIAFLSELIGNIDRLHPGLEPARQIHELGRRVITRFVEDVIGESTRRVARAGVGSVAQVRAQPQAMVAFSPDFAEADAAIKAFLFPKMYRHPRVMKIRHEAAGVLARLFACLLDDPGLMPGQWAHEALVVAGGDPARRARAVADYVAGMTDRFALAEHERLIGPAPDLR